ncbi:BamA/TamA family outer membrane protein [candidate division KSB1 bacterium]|nr:BamA/TamA family outer membrane protein [candidate division KSB1 bacterium]
MKNLIKYFTLFFLLPALSQQAQKRITVAEIEFFGAERVSRRMVQKWADLQKGDPFQPDELLQKCVAILQGYKSAGMPYTRIDSLTYSISPDSSAATVRFYIREGEHVNTGELTLAGLDSNEAENIKRSLYTKTGRPFDRDKLERDLDESITNLEKQGFPFAKYDLQSLRLDSSLKADQLSFTFKVSKGPRLVIQEIQIAGNEVTKDKVIRREIRIKEGELYDYKKVAKIPTKLMKLGYFRRVHEPAVYIAEGDAGGLLITVEEGNTSSFDGVVGYTPGTDEEKGYFTGLINVNLGNLFGTGRVFSAHWQKRDKTSQDMMFHYREPWVAGLPVHLGGGFNQLIQDSTYIQRDYGMDVSVPLVENFSVIADIKKMSILPDSLGSHMLGIPKSETVSASIGIQYDSRDDALNPQSGIYYFTSIETGAKKNLGPDEIIDTYKLDRQVDNKRFVIDIDFYIPTFRRQVVALALHGRQITSTEQHIPLTDQYRLGGTRSLRGYREDQFRGSGIAWTNMEYRYILGPRSRAFVFCDVGYYYAANSRGVVEDLKIGYGFGVRLETGLGIMGIDYGLAYGEKQGLMSGLLHVGLVNEF